MSHAHLTIMLITGMKAICGKAVCREDKDCSSGANDSSSRMASILQVRDVAEQTPSGVSVLTPIATTVLRSFHLCCNDATTDITKAMSVQRQHTGSSF